MPNKIQTADALAFEVMLFRSRISHTKTVIGTTSRRIPTGYETKFRIYASLSIPFAIKIPAVIMMNGITNELRARELQEASSAHALISSEVCSLSIQVWVSELY
jgi:hypothetical protein